jgi:hypothetical protein
MLTPTVNEARILRKSIIGVLPNGVIVKVVYSDETGMGSMKTEPLTVLTAIILNLDRQCKPVEKSLRAILAKTPKGLLENGRELKGKNLYSAVRKGIREAGETLTNVLKVIHNESIPIFHAAIDRANFEIYKSILNETQREKKMTAYEMVFENCVAVIDDTVRTFTEESTLWITDRSDRKREPATRRRMDEHRVRETADVLLGRYTVLKGGETTIADTVYFGDSHESLLLQLADVCCSTVNLYLLEKYYSWRPCVKPYFDIIEVHLRTRNDPVMHRPSTN